MESKNIDPIWLEAPYEVYKMELCRDDFGRLWVHTWEEVETPKE